MKEQSDERQRSPSEAEDVNEVNFPQGHLSKREKTFKWNQPRRESSKPAFLSLCPYIVAAVDDGLSQCNATQRRAGVDVESAACPPCSENRGSGVAAATTVCALV